MKSIIITSIAVMLSITFISAIVQANIHLDNIDKCMSSQYKTTDYEVTESGMLMCRNSNDDYQELKRREM